MDENKITIEEEVMENVEEVVAEATEEVSAETPAEEVVTKAAEAAEDAVDKAVEAAEETVEKAAGAEEETGAEADTAAEDVPEEIKGKVDEIVDKLKALVKEGNVTFIRIRKDDDTPCFLRQRDALQRCLYNLVASRFYRITFKKLLESICVIFPLHHNDFLDSLLHKLFYIIMDFHSFQQANTIIPLLCYPLCRRSIL